ncbi:MAG: hypothetical protein ACI8X3_003612 [Saprospiraceae bacterium]|jgi:hypothetical protein
MKRQISILFLLFAMTAYSFAQTSNKERIERIMIDGEVVSALITETDTIMIADLEEVSVSSPLSFKDDEERKRYRKYRYYANKVYPYAVEAIKIFREVDYVTQTMSNKKRKKHIKRLNKQLKEEFKEPLKNLTKTQGLIMIKMIEKELGKSFYDLVKSLRGGLTAGYWNQLGKFYGYHLKEGYVVGDDHLLDLVLHDFDISHDYKK